MNPARTVSDCRIERYDAAGVADAGAVQRVSVSPGSLLVERVGGDTRVLAIGRPEEVEHHPAARAARRVAFADSVLIPALVNAHTHLDLTDVGPQSPDPSAGFGAFIDLVRSRRPITPEAIDRAVRHGVELLLAGGTAAVGDIAGAVRGRASAQAMTALAVTALEGVSFIEFFAWGRGEASGLDVVRDVVSAPTGGGGTRLRLGLHPHAPYSVSLRGYQWAFEHARTHATPVCTHLAESPDEREFIASGQGPIRDFLLRLGLWDPTAAEVGRGLSPVAHLARSMDEGLLAVHVNDASDTDIQTLARRKASVAYCPRASAWFRAEESFGPHRYRDMLAAGVNVALGTDSVINQQGQASLSVLDEMRLLLKRDGTDPVTLLAMGTVNAARALGLDPERFTLTPGGRVAGVLAVAVPGVSGGSPVERALRSSAPPCWVAGPGAGPP